MDCVLVERELVAYAFATASAGTAAAIDAHLLGCGACLRAYLALRRDLAYAPEVRPGPAAEARLRAEVLATFGPGRRRLPRWVLASAAIVAAWIGAPRLFHGHASPVKPAARVVHVDSARPAPMSERVY